jgi:CRISPR-associated endonuclease Cas1
MFALEVEYLLGRSFAGDFRDRSEPEWPPDPGRLFSALAASFFENGMDPAERSALEWLERQGPPGIRAGTAGGPVKTVAFVPTNYPGDAVPALRGKQPRVFAAQGPSEPLVHFVWRDADPLPEVASVLDKLAGCAAYLGKACSVVRMRATDSPLEPNYVPDPAGERVLRVPSPGRLRIGEICQVSLMGNVQISTQAVQTLCEAEVPICYFSMGGWFYGITTGLNEKNVFLRRSQFRLAEEDYFARAVARRLVAGKIRNQRTLLQRNHVEPRAATLAGLKEMAERAERAGSLAELLGIEGNAARLYFGDFAGMIKPDEERPAGELPFDFEGRNRRPPRDPVNALLSLGYSLLAKDLTVACYAVGFDPYIGFYHQPRFGRPALALDLMEPFRPLIVDSAVLTGINRGW